MILILRWGVLVLFFRRVDVLARMAQAGFVITLIAFHKDKSTSLLACLKEFWQCNIDIAGPKAGRDEGSAISLKLLECKLRGVGGT
jgi:hypothetical protein